MFWPWLRCVTKHVKHRHNNIRSKTEHLFGEKGESKALKNSKHLILGVSFSSLCKEKR